MKRHASFKDAATDRRPRVYLTSDEAAAYGPFSSLKAFRRWLDRNVACPRHRRPNSQRLWFDRDELDAYLALSASQVRALESRLARASGPAASRPASSSSREAVSQSQPVSV